MAMTGAVWGIDIGQCALKALRCLPHEDRDDRIVADAFDYIEYPKILSQPGAEPAELIGDALTEFLSRNNLKGDKVAISVSGQSGLARFIKLPPVEAKKIPDIVRYEARQQIPFDLNDVIWDYQRMGGGSEEEGFAMETEIGLFAMKRDAVFRALQPFQRAGIEVDFVQLMPLTLYNFMLFDRLADLPPPEEYDPESPPESVVVLSIGTDATDLVVTNGYRVWQRNIPLGGNHFTKALTQELKLTFAKAEHLKRNATKAEDPKAIFQAMRPVFNDLLTELQRSIGYFTSIERRAEISHVVALGNAMKLPGLRRYLSQSLGFEVQRLDEFRRLSGHQVLNAPAFKDNALCFGACYGLALQGLGKAGLRTNLLPKEIIHDRLIRRKKPWAVAAAAVLMLACTISFAFYSRALSSVDEETWNNAENQAKQTIAQSEDLGKKKEAAEQEFAGVKEVGERLVGNVERRILWLELLHAINQCLPPYLDEDGNVVEKVDPFPHASPLPDPPPIPEREELHITSLDCEQVPDLAVWFESVRSDYQPLEGQPPVADPENPDAEGSVPGPSGPGWVITIEGRHYHNFADARRKQGPDFVRDSLVGRLYMGEFQLPTSKRVGTEPVGADELGIGYPVLVKPKVVYTEKETGLKRFDFEVQFCWQQATPSEREERRKEEEARQKAAEDTL